MKNTVYTIGYSGYTRDQFVEILIKLGIGRVIDVRSSPYCLHSPEYNCLEMEVRLKEDGIRYESWPEEFGARQENPSFYSEAGILDFEVFASSPQFLRGLEKASRAVDQGERIALMCKEEEPIECHRAILVARAFHDRGYPIVHICPCGSITQEDLEEQLLDRYFPQREPDPEILQQAYRLCNRDIGYHRKPDA